MDLYAVRLAVRWSRLPVHVIDPVGITADEWTLAPSVEPDRTIQRAKSALLDSSTGWTEITWNTATVPVAATAAPLAIFLPVLLLPALPLLLFFPCPCCSSWRHGIYFLYRSSSAHIYRAAWKELYARGFFLWRAADQKFNGAILLPSILGSRLPGAEDGRYGFPSRLLIKSGSRANIWSNITRTISSDLALCKDLYLK